MFGEYKPMTNKRRHGSEAEGLHGDRARGLAHNIPRGLEAKPLVGRSRDKVSPANWKPFAFVRLAEGQNIVFSGISQVL